MSTAFSYEHQLFSHIVNFEHGWRKPEHCRVMKKNKSDRIGLVFFIIIKRKLRL